MEVAAKAVLKHWRPDRVFGGAAGHRIRSLLEEVAETQPGFKAVLEDSEAGRVIDVLEGGYTKIRYGEGVLGTDLGATLQQFDSIAWKLLTSAREVVGYQEVGPSFLVGDQALSAFRWRLQTPIKAIRQATSGEENVWGYANVTFEPWGE